MPESSEGFRLPGPLVALAGWIVPGAGYWLIGDFARGTIVCAAIIVLWLSGILIAGVRVIEVPGYDSQDGSQIRMTEGRRVPVNHSLYPRSGWALTNGGFISELFAKPWFAGQVLAGPISLATAAVSVNLAQRGPDYPRPHGALETIGTLYAAIAGMLNLLVMIDSAYRAGQPPSTS
jgi:hypothetical protein